MGFPDGIVVKNPPTVRVLSLGWKDPLKEKMATYSSILARKIPWIEEPSRLFSPCGHKELIRTEHTCKKIKLLVIPL